MTDRSVLRCSSALWRTARLFPVSALFPKAGSLQKHRPHGREFSSSPGLPRQGDPQRGPSQARCDFLLLPLLVSGRVALKADPERRTRAQIR